MSWETLKPFSSETKGNRYTYICYLPKLYWFKVKFTSTNWQLYRPNWAHGLNRDLAQQIHCLPGSIFKDIPLSNTWVWLTSCWSNCKRPQESLEVSESLAHFTNATSQLATVANYLAVLKEFSLVCPLTTRTGKGDLMQTDSPLATVHSFIFLSLLLRYWFCCRPVTIRRSSLISLVGKRMWKEHARKGVE